MKEENVSLPPFAEHARTLYLFGQSQFQMHERSGE